ncbi:hypothetical protein M0R45_015676 [Rubus argutus]|uniref:Isopenicillin N synthase-like Fe(2+) 2OG dioxygenase domain-containing protein n=1 Tax=Rubus argutus TaxID=59490 RepID=A0AAW1XRJ1_RUBAR
MANGLVLSLHHLTACFMAGDGLQVWSNDRIKACHHRVKHCGNKARYSMGMFTFNNGVFQRSPGSQRSPIKAYCGVTK